VAGVEPTAVAVVPLLMVVGRSMAEAVLGSVTVRLSVDCVTVTVRLSTGLSPPLSAVR
jgi:hypothetical protein